MKLRHYTANSHALDLLNGVMVLFSYETPVALKSGDTIYRSSTKYSPTTGKHISAWRRRFGYNTPFLEVSPERLERLIEERARMFCLYDNSDENN